MIKFFKILLIITFFTGLSYAEPVKAQYYPEQAQNELPGRFFIAPDFSLVLGNLTRIEFSPLLGYHITPRLIGGIGGRFEYYREKSFINNSLDIQTMIYGYRIFTRLIIIKDIDEIIPLNIPLGIFGHAEYESLSLEERYFRLGYSTSNQRYWLNSVLAGPGITQRTGQRTAFNVMVLWDLTSTASSPFSYPTLRFGIQIYL
jgi:hypothetical protein